MSGHNIWTELENIPTESLRTPKWPVRIKLSSDSYLMSTD